MRKIHLFGDSTCAIKLSSRRPETGWGEAISSFLGPEWLVYNNAVNGMSSKSCLLTGVFYDGFYKVKEGDVVIIQFGHNENKKEEYRQTEAFSSFIDNLDFMCSAFLKKGAKVILLSSITRRLFVDGKIKNTHEDYPRAMELYANKKKIPFVDMNALTIDYFNLLGEEASLKYFMNFKPGLYENYPLGSKDNTHLREDGAKLIANMVYEEIKGYL